MNDIINSVVDIQPIRKLLGQPGQPVGMPVQTQISKQTANQLYKKTKHKYALKPDNRIVQAAAQLKLILTGQPAESLEFKYQEGFWLVFINQNKIGRLPEIPSFKQGLEFLLKYADLVLKQHPLTITPLGKTDSQLAGTDGFYPQHLTQNLVKLDQQWRDGKHTEQVLLAVLENLVRMVFGSVDELQFTDDLAGRSLAVLVLAKRLVSDSQQELESQLAYSLGYRAHAKNIIREMPEDMTWKRFLQKDVKALKKELGFNNAAPEARFYLLKLFAASHDYAEWVTHMQQYYHDKSAPIHAMMSGFQLGRFDTLKRISRSIPGLVVDSAADKNNWKRQWEAILPYLVTPDSKEFKKLEKIINLLFQPNVKQQFRQFNALLDSQSELYTGPFLDKSVWRDYQKSFFVNSIYKHGRFNLDSWNNLQETENFSKLLQAVDNPDAQHLATFFQQLLKAEKGEAEVNELVSTMNQMNDYGPLPQFRLYEEIDAKLNYGSPLVSQILPIIVENIDGRMGRRISYANMLRSKALYLSKAEQVYLSNLRDGGDNSVSLEAWLARYFGEHDKLTRLLKRKKLSASVVNSILGKILHSNLSDSEQDVLYLNILDRYPKDWDIYSRYIDALESREDHKKAIGVANYWLKTVDEHTNTFDYYQALIALSRNYRQINLPKRSLKIISPILKSYYGWAFYEATEVYLQLENYDSALKIAKEARKRYETSTSSLMNLVKVYWHRAEYDTAAGLLQNGNAKLSVENWRWKVGSAFVVTFENKTDSGLKAAKAMLKTSIEPINLSSMAVEINKQKLYHIAFYIQSNIEVDNFQSVYYKINAYSPMKSMKGKQQALDWLSSQVSKKWKNRSSMLMMENEMHELLWDFIRVPDPKDHPDMIWLTRAAAYIQNPVKEPETYLKLLDYYNDENNNTYIDQLGRMAMNLNSGDALLNLAADANKLGEISYYKAIQEYGNGNFNLAADWFLVTLETGYKRNAEYRWAHDKLYTWESHNKSIEQYLESKKIKVSTRE